MNTNTKDVFPPGFTQRDGYVSAHFKYSIEGEDREVLRQQSRELEQAGYKVLLTDPFGVHYPYARKAPHSPNFMELHASEEQIAKSGWDELVKIVIESANGKRTFYNERLENLLIVDKMLIHLRPITLDTIKILPGWKVFLRLNISDGQKGFELLSLRQGAELFDRLATLYRGVVERVSKDGKVIFGMVESGVSSLPGPIPMQFQASAFHLRFHISPTGLSKLSMLTSQNIFQEKQFDVFPFLREPTIR